MKNFYSKFEVAREILYKMLIDQEWFAQMGFSDSDISEYFALKLLEVMKADPDEILYIDKSLLI